MKNDVLSAQTVKSGLSTRWAGQTCVYFDEIDSTNIAAKRMAQEGAPHGTLVIAAQQTAGRGRRGRAWETQRDENIMMTLLLRPHMDGEQVALLSLVCAVATAQGIRAATGLDAKIKWPNDVVVQGHKVCGMLLEMTAAEGKIDAVAAGVGINVHQREFPQAFAKTASSLDVISGREISRTAVIQAFLAAFETLYERFEREGVRALMADYRALSATLGSEVRVIGVSEEFAGRAIELDESGALVVQLPDGEQRTVLAGDVSVRGLMGYV